jgi:ribose transport system ATP-binding protein
MVRDALDLVRHPEISPSIPVRELSVGAKQLVEIARALLNRSRILVMDEPTSSLTQEDSLRLFEIIGKLKGQGVSIVYISHFLEEVQRVADSYTVLRDGRSVGSGPMEGARLEDLIQLMVGQKFTELFPRVEHAVGDVVVSLDALKGSAMTSPVSLTLSKGEILGVAGLIGSGRTEMLRALFGLDRVEGGVLVVSGAALRGAEPWARIRLGLGLLSEDRQGEGLALGRSVADNMTLSDLSPYRRRGFLSPRRQRQAVAGWIGRMKVKARGPGQKAGDLSGGNQQKVALARLLHQRAGVLLLDEPTRGIDVVSKAQIYEWIGRLAGEGKAVLFVSSYLPELLGICDRIIVFHRGAPVESRPTAKWNAQDLMTAATVGRTPRASPPSQRTDA